MQSRLRFASVLTAVLVLPTLAAFAGCGSSVDVGSFGGDDAAADATSDSDPGPVDTGFPDVSPGDAGGCKSDGECDDGFNCTIDTCVAGACQHAVGPASGATACPPSQFCNPQKGCIACATANQCGAACVDIATDDANCGKCGTKCSTASHCVAGSCSCPPGAPVCGGVCVDLKSDPENCNGCGNRCAAGNACVNGTCTCTSTTCGGTCTDLKTDAANCGKCGKSCNKGEACLGGVCQCPAGQSLCGGSCVDTTVDNANCGSCNKPCAGICQMGVCQMCPVVDLFFLMDQSGSMGSDFTGGGSTPFKYDAVASAIDAFAVEPASSKLELGLGFWPVDDPSTTACMTDVQCGAAGLCNAGTCADSCTAARYGKPAVGFGPQPTTAASIKSTLAAKSPNTLSSPPPGLEGTLAYAKQWALANPTHKVAIVLIADSAPNLCSTSMAIADLNPIAKSYATGTPAVPTYVLGLPADTGDAAAWNALAVAGGTTKAYLPMTAAEVLPAFDAIRDGLTVCK
jgi:hypothetical protein